MTKPDQILKEHREEVLATAARHKVVRVRVFGSIARGEAREDSDVDLLVQFAPGASLLDQAGLLNDLEDLLGCPVDVVSEGGLRRELRDGILADAVPL
jgi:uncharacterized protein